MANSPKVSPKSSHKGQEKAGATAWFVARCSTCWAQAIVPAVVTHHAPPTVPALCPACGDPPRPFFLLAVIRSLVPAKLLTRMRTATKAGQGPAMIQSGLPLLDVPDIPGTS